MGIERTRGGGTLLLFDAQFASQVEEATRNVTETLEDITGRKLSWEFKETHGIGEHDSRRDEPSDSSEMDNTLMITAHAYYVLEHSYYVLVLFF